VVPADLLSVDLSLTNTVSANFVAIEAVIIVATEAIAETEVTEVRVEIDVVTAVIAVAIVAAAETGVVTVEAIAEAIVETAAKPRIQADARRKPETRRPKPERSPKS
jgi:hypothetical protein